MYVSRELHIALIALCLLQITSGKEDPYSVLGLSPTASMKEIKRAFRSKSLLAHPDKRGQYMTEDEYFVLVDAYKTIVGVNLTEYISNEQKPVDILHEKYFSKDSHIILVCPTLNEALAVALKVYERIIAIGIGGLFSLQYGANESILSIEKLVGQPLASEPPYIVVMHKLFNNTVITSTVSCEYDKVANALSKVLNGFAVDVPTVSNIESLNKFASHSYQRTKAILAYPQNDNPLFWRVISYLLQREVDSIFIPFNNALALSRFTIEDTDIPCVISIANDQVQKILFDDNNITLLMHVLTTHRIRIPLLSADNHMMAYAHRYRVGIIVNALLDKDDATPSKIWQKYISKYADIISIDQLLAYGAFIYWSYTIRPEPEIPVFYFMEDALTNRSEYFFFTQLDSNVDPTNHLLQKFASFARGLPVVVSDEGGKQECDCVLMKKEADDLRLQLQFMGEEFAKFKATYQKNTVQAKENEFLKLNSADCVPLYTSAVLDPAWFQFLLLLGAIVVMLHYLKFSIKKRTPRTSSVI